MVGTCEVLLWEGVRGLEKKQESTSGDTKGFGGSKRTKEVSVGEERGELRVTEAGAAREVIVGLGVDDVEKLTSHANVLGAAAAAARAFIADARRQAEKRGAGLGG
jgi:hypothetical protein